MIAVCCFLFLRKITTDTNLVALVGVQGDPDLQALAYYLAEDVRRQICERIEQFLVLWGFEGSGPSSQVLAQFLLLSGDFAAFLRHGGNTLVSVYLRPSHSLFYIYHFVVTRPTNWKRFRGSLPRPLKGRMVRRTIRSHHRLGDASVRHPVRCTVPHLLAGTNHTLAWFARLPGPL